MEIAFAVYAIAASLAVIMVVQILEMTRKADFRRALRDQKQEFDWKSEMEKERADRYAILYNELKAEMEQLKKELVSLVEFKQGILSVKQQPNKKGL